MTAAVSIEPRAVAVIVRPAREDEHAFIQDSWVKSYQSLMPPHCKDYGLGRWGWVQRCARHGLRTGLTLVAVQEDYDDVILGWACAHPEYGALHYVYVKSAARRMGVATALLSAIPNMSAARMTHRPGNGLRAKCAAMGLQWRPLTLEEVPDGR